MKFYVAGKWNEKPVVQNVMKQLQSRGHEITHDWTAFEVKYTDEWDQMSQCAQKDIEGVRECDIYIAIMTDPEYPYRGTYTELGAALALGKTCYIIGPKPDSLNCFWCHPDISHRSVNYALVKTDTGPIVLTVNCQ